MFKRLGEAKGTSGKLRFKPVSARGGKRSIVAVVERDGLAYDNVTLASYTVRAPPKPGVAKRLKAVKRSGALTLTWTPPRNSRRQEVRVRLSNGIGQVFRISARTRRLKIPQVAKTVTGKVTVVGIRADGVAGRTARLTVRSGR